MSDYDKVMEGIKKVLEIAGVCDGYTVHLILEERVGNLSLSSLIKKYLNGELVEK